MKRLKILSLKRNELRLPFIRVHKLISLEIPLNVLDYQKDKWSINIIIMNNKGLNKKK
jgi:hypothetical protein